MTVFHVLMGFPVLKLGENFSILEKLTSKKSFIGAGLFSIF